MDSVYVGDDFCYRIDYFPKRKHDLAFTGTIWITKEDYALKQIDASVAKSSNLNFVEKMRVQQELVKTEAGPWLAKKTRVLVIGSVAILVFFIQITGIITTMDTIIS